MATPQATYHSVLMVVAVLNFSYTNMKLRIALGE